MNGAMIRYILGYILKIEAGFLLLPCIVAVIYREPEGFSYVFTALLCGVLGILITRKKPQNTMFFLKESCVVTALSWILMSLFGCLPFWFSREIPSFINALFETVSGFTTTGASILSDVEALSHCALFWRSFTHWIGGMGVLIFLLAVLPLSSGSHVHLMRVESPGPSVSKLVPKLRQTARILYFIYIGLTVMQILFLLAGNMSLFDSLTITFGTAGTGGFGIKNNSMAGYSPYLQWVTTVFMLWDQFQCLLSPAAQAVSQIAAYGRSPVLSADPTGFHSGSGRQHLSYRSRRCHCHQRGCLSGGLHYDHHRIYDHQL